MHRRLFYMIAISLFILFLVCCKKGINTHLSFKIITMDNKSIDGAQVYLNGKLLCSSNKDGYCAGHAELSLKEPMVLQIQKDSPDTYFEILERNIYFEELRSAKFTQEYKIYTLPKANITKPESNTEGSATKNIGLEKSNEVKELSSNDPKDLPTSEISQVDPLLENPPTTAKDSSLSPVDLNQSLTLTIQSLHQLENLESVEIYMEDRNSLRRNLICTTNHRGRCTVTLPSEQENQRASFIAYRQGFRKEILHTQLTKRKIIRFNLQKGENHEIKLVEKSYNSLYPITNAKISLGQNNIGTTDLSGSFLLDARYLKQYLKAKIQINCPDHLPNDIEIDPSSLLQPDSLSLFTLNSVYPAKVRFAFLKTSNDMEENNFFRLVKTHLQKNHGFMEIPNHDAIDFKKMKVDVVLQMEKKENFTNFQILSPKNHLLFEDKLLSSDISEEDKAFTKAKHLADSIYKNFPFELSVLKTLNSNEFLLNINNKHPIQAKLGERISILDTSSQIIGKAIITELDSDYIKAKILELINTDSSDLSGRKVVLSERIHKEVKQTQNEVIKNKRKI